MDQVDTTLSEFAKNSARYALKRRIWRRGQTPLILTSPANQGRRAPLAFARRLVGASHIHALGLSHTHARVIDLSPG
jgi:hypothetical protein